ncbi:MAG: SprT family zinc-dependent metalloprotease [Bdellovibrionota bacterium]
MSRDGWRQSEAMFGFFRSGSAPRSPLRRKSAPSKESLEVHGRQVEVQRRARKRSLGLTVHVSGRLRVSAPKSISLKKIFEFVESQREWVENNLAKYEVVRAAYPRKLVREGETFPFMGRALVLTFEKSANRTKYSVRIRDARLVVEIPANEWERFDRGAIHRELRPLLVKFYQKAGRELLTARVERYANAMSLFPSGLSFRSQKTRWGSCSSKGRISLNWRLIVAPLDVIDYVVVHELAHLVHYDHSKAFWQLVGTQFADHRVRRRWLREHAYDADFLAPRSELHA